MTAVQGGDGDLRRWSDERLVKALLSVERGNHDAVQGWFLWQTRARERPVRFAFSLAALAVELHRRRLPALDLRRLLEAQRRRSEFSLLGFVRSDQFKRATPPGSSGGG